MNVAGAILQSEGTLLSSPSAHDQIEGRGFSARSEGDGERLFRRAMRHSRRVRLLRKTIPVLVVLILGATALVRWFDPMSVLARLPSAQGVVISGTKITMAAPKLSGYTSDSRWYEMTAQSAAQDVTTPNVFELNAVRATFETGDKSLVKVSSDTGIYDRASGMLTLLRDVKLVSGGGYDVRLEEAVINTVTSDIVSDKPVEVRTDQATVKANRLEVVNGGEVIVFIGDVNMYIPASDPNAAPKPADKP